LTIPGHVHIQGNLQVGDKGDLNNPDKANTNGKLWVHDIGTRNLGGNVKINDSKVDLWSGKTGGANGTETITIHPRIHCNIIKANKDVECKDMKALGWLSVDNWAHFKNRVKMSWIPDNSKQGKRIQEKGELFREDWVVKIQP
jgi:hypothetical protein